MTAVSQNEVTVNGITLPLTSGYMLSVKVSTHPAMTANGTSVTVYNLTVVALGEDSVDITLTYYWGVADISATVSQYLFTVSDPSCTMAQPTAPPTLVTTVDGVACFTFEKLSEYVSDHTFTITASSPDAGNSATTKLF